jgi:hypothetical protein
MAAGLTDHDWSLREGLCYRVPPWPQGQTVYNSILVEKRGVKRLRALRDRPTCASEGLKTDVEGL